MATDDCITIPLSRGFETVISPADADLLTLKWSATGTSKRPYAFRHPNMKLHRIIMERILGRKLVKGEQVDHIDNDQLNNRRNNLRLATNTQNTRNRGAQKNSSTGYKGVTHHKDRYRAQIQVNSKRIHLGLFPTAEEAHAAYCEASIKYHGEFGRAE